MGLAASLEGPNEGELYMQLVNPGKRPVSGISSKGENSSQKISISTKARLIRKINHIDLWENFIKSQFMTFALTPAELSGLLIETMLQLHNSKDKSLVEEVEAEVKDYLEVVGEICEKDHVKSIDFMAVVSSILLLNPIPIEIKIDQLFQFIQLNPSSHEFGFDDFLVALTSFEKGISYALNKRSCSESYMKDIASQWITLADPLHRNISISNSLANANASAYSNSSSINDQILITNQAFFEFCTNRQHVVRRLLESLAILEIIENKNMSLQEVSDTLDILKKPSSGGDEWMANPAWRKTAEKMIPPSVKSKYVDGKPSSNLEIDWIHGYRGFDCRNNIFFINPRSNSSQIVYTAAAISIVLDFTKSSWPERTQSYFAEHSDDIISVAAFNYPDNPSKCLLASGEIGKTPAIYLYTWSAGASKGSFESLTAMKGCHTKGVSQLGFSTDGKMLCSIGVEYSMAIYCTDSSNVKQFGKLVASGQGPKDRVMHLTVFGESNALKFYTCGEKHIILWSLEHGVLKQENCKLNTHKNKTFLSIVRVANDVMLTSSSEGDLLCVSGTSLTSATFTTSKLPGHGKSSINALHAKGSLVLSGDKDGNVMVWRSAVSGQSISLTPLCNFSITNQTSKLFIPVKDMTPLSAKGTVGSSVKPSPIRALALDEKNSSIIVGTQCCEILQLKMKMPGRSFLELEENTTNFMESVDCDTLVCGHFQGEVWGLSVRPITEINYREGSHFCTVGDDCSLWIWNANLHKPIGFAALGGMARACAYSPDGMYIAVGYGGRLGTKKGKNIEDGVVKVLRVDLQAGVYSLTQVAEIREAKQWISVIRFSPDGSTLAVGSRDNSIYLYSVPNQFRRKAKFNKHNAGINQFDFSSCGKYIQSCCSGYEILFSDANTGAQIVDGPSKLLETEWHTWTLTLGWPVIGIWSGSMDGTDINNVDRSPTGKLLATCDDFGKINLFNWPALSEKGAQHVSYSGHSSHVTCVKWLSLLSSPESSSKFNPRTADDLLVSIGGEDKCVFQWKHIISDADRRSRDFGKSEGINEEAETREDENELDLPSGGDEFMAVKPWLGAIVPPTAWNHPDPNKISSFYASLSEFSNHFRTLNQKKEDAVDVQGNFDVFKELPNIYQDLHNSCDVVVKKLYESGLNDPTPPNADELELDFVYGYRGYDCRNNLFYVSLPEPKGADRYVLYFSAALGILYNCRTRKQSYFRGHNDDILSLTTCEVRQNNKLEQTLVATGQIGMGNIYVWEVPSMQTLSVMTTKQKSVLFLKFSPTGRILVSMAEDKSLSVMDWKAQSILTSTKMDANTLLDVCIVSGASNPAANSLQFFTVGDKLLKLWGVNGRNVTSNKCVTNKDCKLQNFLSVVEISGKFLIGCEDGAIYLAEEKAVKKIFQHRYDRKESGEGKESKKGKGAAGVTCLYKHTVLADSYLLSGAKDGSIVVWNANNVENITSVAAFSIEEVGFDDQIPVLGKQIQSICVHPLSAELTKSRQSMLLLIGTRSCDILEIELNLQTGETRPFVSPTSNGVIMRPHFNEELWGLAAHPTSPEFCSVGDDKTLRIYHLHKRRLLHVTQLGLFSRACSYSSDGKLLAVGFGGRVGKGKEQGDGTVRLYSIKPSGNQRQVTLLSERKDAKQWISDIKFSNDGKSVVAGAHDCKIYIYNVAPAKNNDQSFDLTLRTVFTKHNAVINHLDLSVDSRFMQSNCAGYEILFSDLSTGKQITNPNEVKDVKWQSWTCTLGWPVQGIWGAEMKGSDINAVCRSHTGHLLATSDDSGKIHLFRYPVLDTSKKGEKSLQFGGHSSHVMNIKWSAGDEYLISVGGGDKAIFQWRHTMTELNSLSQNIPSKSEKKVTIAGLPSIAEDTDDGAQKSGDDLLSMELESGGDESLSVKPWVGAVRPPKNPPPINPKPPTIKVDLQWIQGYSSTGISHRQNLYFNNADDVIYPSAALMISLRRPTSSTSNPQEWKQSYFTGHDDDVLCSTISGDRRFLATGQIASKKLKGKASVIVWDALQTRHLSRMDGCHARGVAAVAFNTDSTLLISVGMDDNCTHILWSDVGGNWSRVQQIASVKGDRQATNFLQFLSSSHQMVTQNEYHFVSGNQKTLNLWKIEGSNLTKKAAKLGKKCPQNSTFNSMAQIQGVSGIQTVIGNSTGDILLLEGRELNIGIEKAHSDSVFALTTSDMHNLLISGGKDATIHLWNSSLQMIHSFALPALYSKYCQLPLFDSSIIALTVKTSGEGSEKLSFAVGTAGGNILEVSIPVTMKANKGPGGNSTSEQSRNYDFDKASLISLVSSHFRGELWGLACHPFDEDIFATSGDDSILRVWSIKRNSCIAAKKLTRPARTLAWHPLGTILAVGLTSPEEMNRKAGKTGKKKGKAAAAPAAEAKDESMERVDEFGETEGGGSSKGQMNELAMVLVFGFQHSNSNAELRFLVAGGLPYDPSNPAIVTEGTKGKQAASVSIFSINDIKFTPNGKYLLTAGHDCKIHGFSLPVISSGNILSSPPSTWEEWEKMLKLPTFVLNKHSSSIIHFDCSNDSAYIQSNDIGNELLFFDLGKFKQEPSASKLADYNNHHIFNEEETVGKDGEGMEGGGSKLWGSQTCVFGWSVQGIWPANAYDSSEINSIDRHVSMKFLATSEDSGIVRVLRYPAVVPNSQSISLTGHSSHVTCVRWTIGNHLISVGGNDKAIFIWQFEEK